LYFVSLLFQFIYFYVQQFYQESVLLTEAGTRLSQIYGPKRCAGNENTPLFVIKLPRYWRRDFVNFWKLSKWRTLGRKNFSHFFKRCVKNNKKNIYKKPLRQYLGLYIQIDPSNFSLIHRTDFAQSCTPPWKTRFREKRV